MLKQRYMISSPSHVAAVSLVCAVYFVLAACFTPMAVAATMKKERPTYGRIEVSTTPGGYPILIDGKAAGQTSTTVRLIDLEPGRHTVEILFPNGTRWVRVFDVAAGKKQCIALTYRPRTVEVPVYVPPPKSPCPYPVHVSAPASVNDGDTITFAADVAYGGPSALNYIWTVSPPSARLISGVGTPTITVDSAGLGKQRITAILVVDDGSGDPNCRQRAQASTNVLAPPVPTAQPRKFDEFPSISFNDDKARLDNLAIELQNAPGASAYIIVYGGRRGPAGQADRLGARLLSYLVTTRGIDASRIVVVNGGYRERTTVEFWIVPQGAQPPQATPTVQPSEVRPTITPRRPARRRR